jgi:hypothetical protein
VIIVKRFNGLLIVVLLATLGVGVVSAQDFSETCIQRGGTWDAEQKRCTMHDSVELTVAVPLNYADYPTVNGQITQFLDSTRAEFVGDAVLQGAFSQPGVGGWTLDISYEEYTFTPDIVSVAFSVYRYTGGANGTGSTRSFVFDLAHDQQLTLTDLFLTETAYLDVIAQLARQSLSDQFDIPVDDQWLVDGTVPIPANYQNFALTSDEFLVFFDQYQVGPGVLGPVTARIPLTALNGIMAPAYLP